MEYVRVAFPANGDTPIDRAVLIDDQQSGKTNQTLMVQAGHHEFRLDGPADYTPPVQEKLVRNTADDDPMIIPFDRRTEQGNDA